MALYLCLNEDGTGIVSAQNPIQTKHTSNGEPMTVPVYIFNDGKRKGRLHSRHRRARKKVKMDDDLYRPHASCSSHRPAGHVCPQKSQSVTQ